MIIETKHLSDVPRPTDAPPAYEELRPHSRPTSPRDQKIRSEVSSIPGSSQAGSSSPHPPPTPKTGNTNKNWFGWFSERDTRREVKQTIQSLMRDVVKDPASPASVSVIQSCLEACQARGLSFESIISQKFIEGHAPLYWAIVKLPPLSPDPQDDQVRLIDILLSFPLDSTTRSEAYLACLSCSDQVLFQRLRHMPGFMSPSVSPAAELLLGSAPQDDLLVENEDGDHGEFRISWRIAQFQRRMRVVGGVGTEVLSRGRIWSLAFTVLPRDASSRGTQIKAGSWVASVSLLPPSPATHLNAQFIVSEPTFMHTTTPACPLSPSHPSSQPPRPPVPPDHPQRSSHPHSTSQARKDSRLRWPTSTKNVQKPPICLRVKTNREQLESLSAYSSTPDLREHVLTEPGSKTLIVPFYSHPNGDGLQFDDCTYLNPDDSLSVVFEARLARSNGGECTIC